MNRLGAARVALASALEPVLPGRVSSHPATARAAVPSITIEQPTVSRTTIGTRTVVAVATFPVWLRYDGADRAQVDGLDDLVSQAWDAVSRIAQAEPVLTRPTDVTGPDLRVQRAVVLSVDVTLTAVTLCLPTVDESPIPPVPQEVAHG